MCIYNFALCFCVHVSRIDIINVDTYIFWRNSFKFTYALKKILMTPVEFDSEMYFLKLSNDPENDIQNYSEELKIVWKFRNYFGSPNHLPLLPPTNQPAVHYSLPSFTFFARLLLARLALIPHHIKVGSTEPECL